MYIRLRVTPNLSMYHHDIRFSRQRDQQSSTSNPVIHRPRQNQRPHDKNKYFTAKAKYLTAKPKLFCFCCEIFGFAVRFLVLPWGILFLPWGFWFCRPVTVVGHHSGLIHPAVNCCCPNLTAHTEFQDSSGLISWNSVPEHYTIGTSLWFRLT